MLPRLACFSRRKDVLGCEVVRSYMIEVACQLILLYAVQVLSKKLDIDGEEQVHISVKAYVRTV